MSAPVPPPRSVRTPPLRGWVALGWLLATLLQPATAWAYIDPNAGGFLLQLLAPVFAAVVGAWLFLRRWIADAARRLWSYLTKRQR